MQFPINRSLVALVLLVSLFACSKKVEVPIVPPTPLGMKWSVDGVAVQTTEVSTGYAGPTSAPTYATVEGRNAADGTIVDFDFPLPFAVGTYVLVQRSPMAGQVGAYYSDQKNSQGLQPHYVGRTGTLVVTRVTNSTVEGTFSFTAECGSSLCVPGSTKSITNGSFSGSR